MAEQGGFIPFARTMLEDGAVELIAVEDQELPDVGEIIGTLRAALGRSAAQGRLKAAAVVSDIRVATPGTTGTSGAICIELDHGDGYSVKVVFRYRIEQGKPVMGDVTALSGGRSIFPPA